MSSPGKRKGGSTIDDSPVKAGGRPTRSKAGKAGDSAPDSDSSASAAETDQKSSFARDYIAGIAPVVAAFKEGRDGSKAEAAAALRAAADFLDPPTSQPAASSSKSLSSKSSSPLKKATSTSSPSATSASGGAFGVSKAAMGNGFLTGKQSSAIDSKETALVLILPARAVGFIIGTKGVHVKRIVKESKLREMRVQKELSPGDLGCGVDATSIVLAGTVQAVTMGVYMVLQQLLSGEGRVYAEYFDRVCAYNSIGDHEAQGFAGGGKGGGAGGGGPAEEDKWPGGHPGDWVCRECKNANFARRTSCNRCKAPRPADMPPLLSDPPPGLGRPFVESGPPPGLGGASFVEPPQQQYPGQAPFFAAEQQQQPFQQQPYQQQQQQQQPPYQQQQQQPYQQQQQQQPALQTSHPPSYPPTSTQPAARQSYPPGYPPADTSPRQEQQHPQAQYQQPQQQRQMQPPTYEQQQPPQQQRQQQQQPNQRW